MVKKSPNFIETSVLKDSYILSEPLPLQNPVGAATATALYSGGPGLKVLNTSSADRGYSRFSPFLRSVSGIFFSN